MFNIIKSDLYRILKCKAIYVCLIIITIMNLTTAISVSPGHIGISIGSSLNENIQNPEFIEKLQKADSLQAFRDVMKSMGEFALDKESIGQNVNLYYVFIVIVVLVITTDFSNKTIKNTLASSVSRPKYYSSKVAVVFFLSTIILLFSNFSLYLLNYFINGPSFASPIGDIIKLTLIQMPLIYGIISLLLGVSFVFGRTSIFNTISIPFILVVQLIGLGIINLFKINGDWFYNYEIQFALSNLANNPTNAYIIKCIILGFSYIIIFNIIGYIVFKNKEIK